MAMNTPEKIIERLEDNLIEVDWKESRVLLYIKTTIGICSSTLLELRDWINRFNFSVKNDEVHFFKVTKFNVLSMCFFHHKHSKIVAIPAIISIKGKRKYLIRMISEGQFFIDGNPEFYPHFRSVSVHLDDNFFIGQIKCSLFHSDHEKR